VHQSSGLLVSSHAVLRFGRRSNDAKGKALRPDPIVLRPDLVVKSVEAGSYGRRLKRQVFLGKAQPLLHQEITASIIRCFFTSYNKLDFGFSEHVVTAGLQKELVKAGHQVDREVLTKVMYDGEAIAHYRVDMVVDKLIVVEVKAGADLAPGADRQVFNYLRATQFEVGLLFHYGPRPTFKRYLCTADRKGGFDLRQGSSAGLEPTSEAAHEPEP
jgi:GxxExxY protein